MARQDLPLPETRRAVSRALRMLEIIEKLTPQEMVEAGSVLSTLVQIEIARRNAAAQAVKDE